MEFEIRLGSVQDVQEFVSIATTQPFAVTVGNVRHRVNGKSFMETFCLDFDLPVTACCDSTDEEGLRFRSEVARFLVE